VELAPTLPSASLLDAKHQIGDIAKHSQNNLLRDVEGLAEIGSAGLFFCEN
jgi:hypothetical protein